jgi:hypothetical protein
MWIHKLPNGDFTITRIDKEFNIFYYNQATQQYTNPVGEIMKEKVQ